MTFKHLSAVLLAACVVAATLGRAPAASATYPGANGAIVFTSGQTGHRHIFITTAGGIRDLTGATSTAIDANPQFSPDGSQIAFTRTDPGHLPGSEIFLMSTNGTHRVQLTNTPLGNSDPTFSPDGQSIAFVSQRNGNVPNIYIMRSDGTQVHQITHDNLPKADLTWSPRGDRIAFSGARSGGGLADIYTIKPDGSGLRDLTNDPTTTDAQPSYSPDGSQIVYAGPLHPKGSVGGDLWIMNADGSGAHPLEHETNGYSDGGFPAWSPDGTRIAFAANNGSGYYHLWSVPAGGGENTDLVANKVPGGNPVDQEVDWQPLAARVPPPVNGRSVDVAPVSGTVLVRRRGQKAFAPLVAGEQIPVGSTVDTTHGRVTLTSAKSVQGGSQSADFYGGAFAVGQARGHALTMLKLTGGNFSTCGRKAAVAASPAARAAKPGPRRRLWGNGHGSFTTSGNSASATVRGTIWLTEDDCAGTLVKVMRGVVAVRDFARRKTILVHAPHSYFAARK